MYRPELSPDHGLNPGATAIFGYQPEEMIGNSLDSIYAVSGPDRGLGEPASRAGNSVVEFDGRRRNGEVFPAEASFSRWQGTEERNMERSSATYRRGNVRPRVFGISRIMTC